MTVLVDSDILIEVTRAKDAAILARWVELSRSGAVVMCSPVSVAELWQGARPREHDALAGLFRVLACPPIDLATARLGGEFLRDFRKSHGLELGDALIAAAAVLNGASLWTRNRKHYPMRDATFY